MTGYDILKKLQEIQNIIYEHGLDKEYDLSERDFMKKEVKVIEKPIREKQENEVTINCDLHYKGEWKDDGNQARKLWLVKELMQSLIYQLKVYPGKFMKELGINNTLSLVDQLDIYNSLIQNVEKALRDVNEINIVNQYYGNTPKEILLEWNKKHYNTGLNVLECFEFVKSPSSTEEMENYSNCYINIQKLLECSLINQAEKQVYQAKLQNSEGLFITNDNKVGNSNPIPQYNPHYRITPNMPYVELPVNENTLQSWMYLTSFGKVNNVELIHNLVNEADYKISVTLSKEPNDKVKYNVSIDADKYKVALYVREEIPVKKLDNDICKDLTKDVEILCVNQVKDKIEEKEDNTKESLEDMFK